MSFNIIFCISTMVTVNAADKKNRKHDHFNEIHFDGVQTRFEIIIIIQKREKTQISPSNTMTQEKWVNDENKMLTIKLQ